MPRNGGAHWGALQAGAAGIGMLPTAALLVPQVSPEQWYVPVAAMAL